MPLVSRTTITVSPGTGAIIMIAFGIGILAVCGYSAYADYSSISNWWQTDATVTFSHLDTSKDIHHKTIFQANIRYAYSVNSFNYSGRCCDWKSSDSGAAQSLVSSSVVGKTVPLLVNPNNPSQSKLKGEVSWFTICVYLVGAASGLLLLIWGIYRLIKYGGQATM